MKSFVPLLTAALLGLSLVANAADSDPGFGDGRRTYNMRPGGAYDLPMLGSSGMVPLYYRPTMRYYGAGYTVSYRYIPVYRQDSIYSGAVGGSSNFRTEAFHIASEEVPAWGANSPRLTVKDPRSAVQHTAVTSIIRKKTTTKTLKGVRSTDGPEPVILPSTAPTPAPDATTPPVKP